MHLRYRSRQAQRGVGLIEVLIAVLVLSFGMLGLVGLQTWSLRNNQSALERGMATVQTNSIVDAMRSDRANAIARNYDIAINAAAPTGTTFRDEAIRVWRLGLQQALNPTATGSIACNPTSGGSTDCRIVVSWNDERAQSGALAFTLTTDVEL